MSITKSISCLPHKEKSNLFNISAIFTTTLISASEVDSLKSRLIPIMSTGGREINTEFYMYACMYIYIDELIDG